jgi:hypothetical protein
MQNKIPCDPFEVLQKKRKTKSGMTAYRESFQTLKRVLLMTFLITCVGMRGSLLLGINTKKALAVLPRKRKFDRDINVVVARFQPEGIIMHTLIL